MASGLLSPLLSSVGKLVDLLRSRSAGRSTVLEDLQRLERLLRRIRVTLDDAGDREIRDSSVKLWIEELTHLALDAENVLDDHRYELLRRLVQERQRATNKAASTSGKRKHEDNGICEKIRKITHRFEISSDWSVLQLKPDDEDGAISKRIGEITRQFEEISIDRASLQLGPEDGIRITGRDYLWESRVTSHLLDETIVFGRTEEKESIIEFVLSCSQGSGIHVLPVVGMGGIGKTTIAQMVYNAVRVKERYDLTGWVHVSQTFGLHRLTCAMAETLAKQPCEYNELSSVHDFLKEKINEKNVFLVLDDLWNEKDSFWQDFLSPLKFAQTATILVTTRNLEVSSLVQTVKPFFLGLLPEYYCWLLFRFYAFGNRSVDEESSLVQVARKIMQKCGGLPLATKSIGCLLRSKVHMQTWIEISESEFWEYSDDNDEIFSALRLSFNHLPARLKPYFLLCALYPKGRPFTKDDMIHLWIAHGCIQHTRNKLPEQVASEYFDELKERSLIEADLELCNDGHHMEKSLAEKVASENFDELNEGSLIAADLELRSDHQYMGNSLTISQIEISSGQLPKTDQHFFKSQVISLIESFKRKRSSDQSHSASRLYKLHDMIWDLAKSLSSHILSVTDYNTESGLKTAKVQNLILSIYRVNRELSLEEKRYVRPQRKVKMLNSQLDNLVTMLFDDYSFQSFGTYKLAYLRTLVLHSVFCVDRLSNIQNLRHLRYLQVADYRTVSPITMNERTLQLMECLPEKICDLYSLEKLIICTAQDFSIKSCSLISLRYLHLSFQFNDWSCLPFSELRNLDTLCLQNCHGITELPFCIGNIVNLQRLQLSEIPKIKSLNHDSFRLQNNINKCQMRNAIFPSLKEIEFDRLSNLRNWHVSQDSDCPKLQNITIRNCSKLETIPYFASVRELIISNSAIRNLQLSFCNAPSQLQTLDIRNCQKLSSLMELENLRSLGSLYVARCPKLIVSPKRKLLYTPPHHVFIHDCAGLMYWCDRQKLHYKHPDIVKLSDLKRAKVFGLAYFHSLGHLSVDICPEKGPELVLSPNNWLPCGLRLLKFHGGLSTLHRLEIKGCPKLLALMNLEELYVLQSLVIADCPLLYLLPEMEFPPRMASLIIQGCHKLHSLQLNLSDPSWFIELEVSDCQGLLYIRGLRRLRNLESLVLLHCLLLQIQEPLPHIPEYVAVFLCPKLKKWCERQNIEYQESLPDFSPELDD